MTTRRQALAAAAAGAAALALPAVADAKGEDRGVLEFLVVYVGSLVASYELTLAHAPLRARDRETLGRFHAEVQGEYGTLRAALSRLGETPHPVGPLSVPASVRIGREPALRYLVAREELAASGWYAALQKLVDVRLVENAASSMAAGGRRLVVLREFAGMPLLPNAFETGSS